MFSIKRDLVLLCTIIKKVGKKKEKKKVAPGRIILGLFIGWHFVQENTIFTVVK